MDYLFIILKLMGFLKLFINQNVIVIHHKSNKNFKNYINFEKIKKLISYISFIENGLIIDVSRQS
jgi:Holliday junction resolvase